MTDSETDPSDSPWNLSLKERLKLIDFRVAILVLLFATCSWLDIEGALVELPILVHTQPEGWSLPSYVNVLIQVTVVASLFYTLANKFWPGDLQRREVITSYGIILTGAVGCLLLVFVWPITAYVAGAERSVAYLLVVFLICVKTNLSVVVFFPYMTRFKDIYLPAYLAGEGMGGLITGLMGLTQGSSAYQCRNSTKVTFNETTGTNVTLNYVEVERLDPQFSVSAFFAWMSAFSIIGIVSFTLLNKASFCKQQRVDAKLDATTSDVKKPLHSEKSSQTTSADDYSNSLLNPDQNPLKEPITDSDITIARSVKVIKPQNTALRIRLCYLLYSVGPFFIMGLEPSLRSYACLPYGTTAYNLGMRMKMLLSPASALASFFLNTSSLAAITALMGTSVVLSCFHFYLAAMSPEPPLQDHVMGPIIVVSTLIIIEVFFTYSCSLVACVMKQEGGHQTMLYGGFAFNVGATLGGVLGFVLVSVLQVFKDAPPCPGM